MVCGNRLLITLDHRADVQPGLSRRLNGSRQIRRSREDSFQTLDFRTADLARVDMISHRSTCVFCQLASDVIVQQMPDDFVCHLSNLSLKSLRARCSCALIVPTETLSCSAISWCWYPSMSCKTNASLAPFGNEAIASSRSIFKSMPLDRAAPARRDVSSIGSTLAVLLLSLLAFSSIVLTARRWSHDENAQPPRNVESLRHARTKTSCITSVASEVSPALSRRHSA